ncbi:MAG: ribosome-associated translation inhibitor RaiA [Chloroflexi bacterium]|nr:ribosome-associated translation inhibitor RaiA [Chloroflexota bacterium]
MDIQLLTRNPGIANDVRDYAEKKVTKLERYLPAAARAKIELTFEKTRSVADRAIVQVTLSSNGSMLRAQHRSSDFRTSTDAVVHALERQAQRFKARLYRSEQRHPKKPAEVLGPEPAVEPESGVLVRRKRYAMKPMIADEAIAEMLMLGHDFYMFMNAETREYAVVYRRSAGDFGLIEPEPL